MLRSAALLALLPLCALAAPSFVIEGNNFVKDGEPFRLRSGSIHYSRVHPSLWNDRLQRLAAMGMNAVQVYTFWNWHEQEEGVYDFTGARDIATFFRLAQNNGLVVLWRAGPVRAGVGGG